jgi:hypothetical protein
MSIMPEMFNIRTDTAAACCFPYRLSFSGGGGGGGIPLLPTAGPPFSDEGGENFLVSFT